MTGAAPTYGYFGKLPHSGDFLRAGLSPGFVTGWDGWLQDTLLTARAALGEEPWFSRYLTAPIWRFATAPGLCGPRGAAGMVMPSLDRVGRRFPFCAAFEHDLPAIAAFLSLQPVAEALEEAALRQLDDGAARADLDAALADMPAPARIVGADQLGARVGSLWLTATETGARIMVCDTLPFGRARAAALFDLDAPFWGSARPHAESPAP